MFRLLRLEDRIVLDGAALTDLLDEMHSQEMHEQQMADADAQADDASATDDIGIDTDAMLYIDDVAADDTGTHVLVISSEVKDGEDLAAAAKDNVIVVKYDPAKTTLDDLSAMIKDALGGEKADSIAFASHYTNTGIMALSGSEAMSADSLETSADQQEFWKSIGGMVDDGGRIDLLACDVAGKDGGEEFVSQIESISGVNVAASVDSTGNEAYGGDWVLETDNVDVQATYFDADKIEKFDELLGAQPPIANPNGDIADRVYNYAGTKWNSVYFKVTPGYTDADDPIPVLPAGQYAFIDPDDSYTSLTYSQTNDSDLGWLKFSTSGWYFYGTPPPDMIDGTVINVTLKGDDATLGNATATQDFTILFLKPVAGLPTATLAVTPATLYEDGFPSQATVTVNLSSAAPTGGVTVYLGNEGTASSTDFSYSPSVVTIAAGATAGTSTLTILSDTVPEGTETVVVTMFSITGANRGTTNYQQTVQVIDNDGAAAPTVNLSMSPTSVTEGNAATITANLSSAAPAGGVTVSLGYAGTYESGDFTAANSIFITAGSSTGSITFQTNQDDLDVDNEAVTVSITGVVGASLGATTSVNATIIDNDYPSVALSLSSPTFNEEGGSTNVIATLSQAAPAGATIYLTAGGTAVLNTDYSANPANLVISVLPGGSTGVLTLTGKTDTLPEGNETVILDIASATGAQESGVQQVTATILDDDLVTVALSASQLSFAEEGGTTVITATLNKAAGSMVQVNLVFTGTAGSTDYTASLGYIQINAGSTSGFITLTGTTDTAIEGPETVTVSIDTLGGGAVKGTPDSVTTSILDNDMSTVTLAMSATSFNEFGGSAKITAYLDQPAAAGGVTVNLNFAGSATKVSDYTVAPEAIYITAGAYSGEAVISSVDDTLVEGNETLTASIGTIAGQATAGAVNTASLLIVDDDAINVTLGISTQTLAENNGPATLTAYLSKSTDQPITVNLSYGGVAGLGTDFSAATSIVIDAGATFNSITITATSDMLVEGNETLTVTGTPVNASLGTPLSVTANIIDDDLTPVNLSLSGSPFEEDGGIAVVTAVLDQPSANNVVVGLDFAGTGLFGTDYTASATSITILAGTTNASLNLTGKDDTLVEYEETVLVTIATLSGGATFGATKSVTALITDDEVPVATIAISKFTFSEASGSSIVTVTLDKPAGAAGVFAPLVISGDVTGADYLLSPVSVNIPAGKTTGTATIYGNPDNIYEGDENINISLGTLSGAVKGATVFQNATIVDSDSKPSVSLALNPTSLSEGATSVVTATLTKASAVPTTVDLSLAGSALLSTDYTAPVTRIVIAAGKTTGSVSIGVLTDSLVEGTETVIVDIATVANATETQAPLTLTISDATVQPNVSLSISSTSITELPLSSTVITATMNNTSFAPVTVNLNFAGDAEFGTDYAASPTFIVIPAGSTSNSITLTTKDDGFAEPTESVTVSMGTVTGASPVAPTAVSASIIDDDGTPSVSLSLSKTTFSETSGTTLVVATLNHPTYQDVTVNLGFTGGTAGTTDYTYSGAVIMITAGNTTGSVMLTGTPDSDNEPDETVVVSMGSVINAAAGTPAVVTATLIDDDGAPTVNLSLTNPTFAETGGATTVVATLSAMTMETVTVDLTLLGTAALGSDYTAVPTYITIAPGAITGSIKLTAVPDTIDENDETVVVTMGTLSNVSAGSSTSVTATLVDDDAAPSITIMKQGADPLEGGVAGIEVILSAISSLPVTADLIFSGTALYTTDYSSTMTTVVIPAGITSSNFVLLTVGDTLYEDNETIIVSFGTVENAVTASPDSATVTILDNDALPTVTLGPALSTFLETGASTTVTAYLSAPSAMDTTVDLIYSGTAESTDYTAVASSGTTGSLLIPAGKTTASVTLTSVQDTVFEGNETVVVQLAGVTEGTAGTFANAVLVDNDSVSVSLGITPASFAENTGTATVTAYLNGVSENPITVNLAFSTGTGKALYDIDYDMATSITIPAGSSTSNFVTLIPVNDTLYEGNENVVIDVKDWTVNGITSAATVTGTRPITAVITDDADLPLVTVGFASATFGESTTGNTNKVVVYLDKTSYQPVTVTLAYTGGTSLAGTDYTGASTTLVIPANTATGAVTLTAVDDVIFEGTESVIVNLTTVSGATLGATLSATSSLVDNDGQPNVTLGLSTQTIAEGGATSVVTAYLNHPSTADVTVNLNVTLGTAVSSDYTVTPQTYIVVQAGKMTGSVTLGAFEDCIYEGPETLTLGIGSAVGATYAAGAGQAITITDNDNAPAVSLSVIPVTFAEDGGTAVVTAILSSASALPVTVNLAYTAGTAIFGTDYTATAAAGSTSTTLVIPAGSITGTITLKGTVDSLYEGDESVIVSITGTPVNATLGTVTSVTATIDDSADYPKVTLSASPNFKENGGTALVTATLDKPNTVQDVTVTLSYAGTAVASDYSITPATAIVIAKGKTTGTITLTGINDPNTEGTETVVIDIVSVAGGVESGAAQQVTVNLIDDDAMPTVTLSGGACFAEDGGTALVTATLSGTSYKDVTVKLSFTGAASSSADYGAVPTYIFIPAGKLTGTVSLQGKPDDLYEGNEAFTVTVSNTSVNVSTANPSSATYTVVDGDGLPTVTLGLSATSFTENTVTTGTTTMVVATLTQKSVGAVTIDLNFAGTAGKGTDYGVTTPANATQIVIGSGSTTGSITLTTSNDNIYEGTETVIVTMGTVTGNAVAGSTTSVTASLEDNEAQPTVALSASPTSISEESGTATSAVKVTLSRVSYQDVTVTLGISGSGTAEAADYTLSGTQVVIPKGTTSAFVTLTALNDSVYEPTAETVIVEVLSAVNASEATPQAATISITSTDPAPQVVLTMIPSSFSETLGTTLVIATMDRASDNPVTVGLQFTGGTAQWSTDYTTAGDATQIFIPAGQTTGSLLVSASHDDIYELAESVRVELFTVTGACESGTQVAVATINDNDPMPKVTLSMSPDTSFAENGGTTLVMATMDKAAGTTVTVNLSSYGGTAAFGADYSTSPVSGNVIVISAGSTTGTVELKGLNDSVYEGSETVTVSIASVVNATKGAVTTATATIDDSADLPNISLSILSGYGNTFSENAGSTVLRAYINNSVTTLLPVTVTLNLEGDAGTADFGTDYTTSPAGCTIVIPAGYTSEYLTLTGKNDYEDEADGNITATIVSVENGTFTGTPSVALQIIDDDVMPEVSLKVSHSTMPETNGSTVVTATLATPTSVPVTVTVGLAGTAEYGMASDYYSPTGTKIVIPAGKTTGSLTLYANHDVLYEHDENFVITVADVSGAVNSIADSLTVTIVDDDLAPTVNLSLNNTSFAEDGGSTVVTATLTSAAFTTVTIDLNFAGTAIATDYESTFTYIVISAGETAGSITLTGSTDTPVSLYEGSESVIVSISSVSSDVSLGTVTSVTATINDDADYPTVTLDANPTSFDEAGTVISTVTATLSNPSIFPVTVELGITGTATPDDYTLVGGTQIVIPAYSTTGTVQLYGNDDENPEATEKTIIIDIITVAGANEVTSPAEQQVTLSIVDDDSAILPSVTLGLSNLTFSESLGTTVVTAYLDRPNWEDVTVNLDFAGQAVATTDYTVGPPEYIVIPAGNLTGTLTITGVMDTWYEGDETLIIGVGALVNAAEVGTQQVSATIVDDFTGPIPKVTLAMSAELFTEGESLTVTAYLDGGIGMSGMGVTIDLGYSGSTATLTSDYTASATYIFITAGETSGSIVLAGVDNLVYEGTESVVVNVIGISDGATAGAILTDTASIDDSDDYPTVTLAQSTETIYEANGKNYITAYLSNASELPVTVDLSFTGDADFGTDYTTSATSLVFAPGEVQNTVTILASLDDCIGESDESVIVSIGTVTGGATSAGDFSVTSTIISDEGVPTVSLALLNGCMAEAGGSSTVVATLAYASATDVTITLAVANGTNVYGTDYSMSGSTEIMIPAGKTTGSVSFSAIQDTLYEGNETLSIGITAATGGVEGTVAPDSVIATIIDDDAMPTVNLSLSKVTFSEVGSATTVVTVTLNKVSGLDTTVSLVYSGTAEAADYGSAASSGSPTQIFIPAGDTTATVTLESVGDEVYEANSDSIIVSLGTTITNATAGAVTSVTATIDDSEDIPVVTLGNGAEFAEELGTASLTVNLTKTSEFPVTVTLNITGSAVAGSDYLASPAGTVLVITAGYTSGTISLQGKPDTLCEGTETAIIEIVTVAGGIEATTAAQAATFTIIDSTDVPKVSLVMSSNTFMEDGGTATLTVSLDKATYEDVTVTLNFTVGSPDAGYNSDYMVSATQVMIPAGQTTQSVLLTGITDNIYEDDGTGVIGQERFQVGIVTVIGSVNTVTGAAEDTFAGAGHTTAVIDDSADLPTVTLSVSKGTMVEEGGTDGFTVTATASKAVENPFDVNLAFSGTATADVDYMPSSTVTITGKTGTTDVWVMEFDDTAGDSGLKYEYQESVIVDIASFGATGVTGTFATEGTPNQVTVTITDEEDKPVVTLSYDQGTFLEGGGFTNLTATLNHPTDGTGTTPIVSALPTTVSLDFGGAATLGTDYTATATYIVVTPGQSTGSIKLTALADSAYEGPESVKVTVTAVENGSVGATPSSATATIEETSALPLVTLSLSSPTFGESSSPTQVIATLNAPSFQTVTVEVGFAGTAGFGTDYTSTTTIVISAGRTTGTVTLAGVNDWIYEGTETVIVDIVGVTNGEEDGVQTVTASLVDDETPPKVDIWLSSNTLQEKGGTTTVMAQMQYASVNPVTVTLSYTDNGAAPASVDNGMAESNDYAGLTTIVIPAGQTTATIDITTVDDSIYEGTETFVLAITAVDGGVIKDGVQEETVAIVDDEIMEIWISDLSVSEGDAGAMPTATLTIDRTPIESEYEVTVDWATTGSGTATAGSDYEMTSRTGVSLGTTYTTGSADILIYGDADETEPDETFEVKLSNASVGTFSDDTAVVTIINYVNQAPRSDGAWIKIPESTATGNIGTFVVTDDRLITDVAVMQENYSGEFTVGTPDASGIVTVTLNQTLDYEYQDFYTLDILLMDANNAESRIQVVIEVTNDGIADDIPVDAGMVFDKTLTSTGLMVLDTTKYFQTTLDPVSYTLTDMPAWMTFTNGRLVAEGADAVAAGVTAGTSFTMTLEAVFMHWDGTTDTVIKTFTVDYIASLDFDPLMEAIKYLDGGEDYLLPEEGEAVDVNEVMVARSEAPVYDDVALYEESAAPAVDPELAEIVALLDQEIIMIDPETARV